MTITLGSITFDTEEITGVTVTKGAGITLLPIVDQDSDSAEFMVLEGANSRINLRGNVYKANLTSCQTRYGQLMALIDGSIDTNVISFNMPVLASAINVVVESVEINMDANTIPDGHFSFSINLLQGKSLL